MPAAPTTNSTLPDKYGIPLLLVMIAAGVAGNYFRFPIFLNIDFLFGSIFAMLALQFFGLGRGIAAAAIIAAYTYILWNHPYAIVILTAEAAMVGWLMGHRKIGMVLADTLYWVIVGIPLIYLFYHLVMHVPPGNTYIVMVKQATNGIANALAARLIFTAYTLRTRSSLIPYSEIVNNLLAFFVLCPTLIMLAVSSRSDFNETDLRIRTSLMQDSQRIHQRLETWVANRKSAIINLAELAASNSPQQMQPYLELTKKSDTNFKRIAQLNREATTIAFFPLVDELGQKNIGKNYADRPFIPQLKRTLKPMLSEVVMSRVGTPMPTVSMLAPVVVQGTYDGFVIGVLSLEQVHQFLETSSEHTTLLFTLLDKNGHVVMTNRSDQTKMKPFVRGQGTLIHPEAGISLWQPLVPSGTPTSERWSKSFYIAETTIGDLAEWRLVLEQPVAPFQKSLYENYTRKLTLLFLLVLGTLPLAELISRKIVATLGQLRTLTYELPVKLATDGKDIVWPESGITEAHHLINNFREMAESLSEQFIETRKINESLEERVEQRTQEVKKLTEEQRIILSTMPIGTCFLKQRKVQFANPAFDKILGYMPGETKELNTAAFYPNPETYERIGKEGYDAISKNIIYSTVVEMKKKDGSLVWCNMASQIVNASQPEDGSIWMIQDITEKKQAEKEREQFFTFFETSSDLMVIADPNGAFMKTNPAFTEVLGYSEAELVSKPFIDFIHTDDKQATLNEMKQQIELGRSLNFENRYICKDGSLRWLSWRATYNKDEGVTYAVARDITQNKLAEEKLRKSEALYHSLVETSQDLIWQCDAEGRYTYLNLAWEQVFGYNLNEMIGRKFSDFQPPEYAARDRFEFNRIMEQGCSISGYETTYIGKSGNEIHLVFNALFMSDEQGNIIGTSGTAYDITDRTLMELDLVKAKNAAEAANTTKSQFLANMSHELRTPMNGIIGLTELLLSSELTDEQRKFTELVKLSGRNLVQLISDILDFSKIEAHKIELDTRDFDLQAETSGTVSILSLQAQEKGLELSLQIDADVPLLVKGDARRLRQIITNLVGNAIKFTAKGSVSLHISTVTVNDQQATLRFEVCDTGIGIAADKLTMIFEPFTQADSSTTRNFGGSGLGLSISRQLAELMGGSAGVESVEGQGATFWFTVVLEKQTRDHLQPGGTPLFKSWTRGNSNRDHHRYVPLDPSVPQFRDSLIKGSGTRLLLAEDDPTNQLVTKSILTKFGYQVDVAVNGQEALNLMENNDYDLVLMDCMMPVMSGFDATAVIRDPGSAVRNHAIPVIALTAKAMQEDRDTCLASGMDDYLAKPLDIAELLAMLEVWVPKVSDRESGTSTHQAVRKAAASEQSVATRDIFNRDEFVNRNMGDLELSCDVAATFIEHRREYIEAIRNALKTQETDLLRESAHKLKGAAANLSLSLLSETAHLIESSAETGDLEKAAKLIPDLEQNFELAIGSIQALLITPQEQVVA